MKPNHGTNPTDERRRRQAQPTQQPPPQIAQYQPPQTQQIPPQQPQVPTQQAPVQTPPPRQTPPQQIPTQQAQQQPSPQQAQIPTQQAPAQTPPPQQGQPTPGMAPATPSLTPARVSRILSENVVTAMPDTPLPTVVAMMAQHDIGSVVVVEDDRPVGIVTDRDVALTLQDAPESSQLTAEDLLDGDLTVADPSMSVFDALQLMHDETIRRLPIVDDDGTLRGIVTLDDILVLLGERFGQLAGIVDAQTPNP